MRNVPNFRVFKIRNKIISPNDMLPLQSIRHRGLCTGPIQCAESPRAVHVAIQQLRGASQGAESAEISPWRIPSQGYPPPYIPSCVPVYMHPSMAGPRPAQFCMIHEVLHDPCGPA